MAQSQGKDVNSLGCALPAVQLLVVRRLAVNSNSSVNCRYISLAFAIRLDGFRATLVESGPSPCPQCRIYLCMPTAGHTKHCTFQLLLMHLSTKRYQAHDMHHTHFSCVVAIFDVDDDYTNIRPYQYKNLHGHGMHCMSQHAVLVGHTVLGYWDYHPGAFP
jgi:hypothetical protein